MYLQIENIEKSFGREQNKVEVLKNISFIAKQGELIVLLGPSGSGKSTLLNIIGGIESADRGDILLDGKSVACLTHKNLERYRRQQVGYVFQAYNLIENLTVKENIEVGAYLSDNPLPLDDLIRALGLWEHKDKLPKQISGGQQQRTSIGRAIIKNPALLLCDEPTGSLDYKTSKEILALIESVNKKYNNTVIMVTHNDAIKDMADRVIRLHDGQIRSDTENEQKKKAKDIEW